METEKCCGAVVFTRENDCLKYLIIRNLKGIYGFPKGHMEKGEAERETALREIFEETGIKVEFLDGFRYEDIHPIPEKPGVMKDIVYFAAEYSSQIPVHQTEELTGVQLMTYDEVMPAFQYENSREIMKAAHAFITERLKIGGDKK